VSPSNIDYYIDTFVAKKTPRMLMWSKQKADQTAQGRIKFMKKLFDLGATGSKVQPKTATKEPTYKFDASRNSYVQDGGTRTIPRGFHLFTTYEIAGYTPDNGYAILKLKAYPKTFVILNPYTLEAV
jgi:hypothetical protein